MGIFEFMKFLTTMVIVLAILSFLFLCFWLRTEYKLVKYGESSFAWKKKDKKCCKGRKR